jgi:uncharacterized protein GlcG (DUF336 family)
MIDSRIFAALSAVGSMGSVARARTLPPHRILAAVAVEAATETVAACAKQGYHEMVQVVDADGVVIATMRGAGAGAFTLDNPLCKAYTAASFKNDTLALAELAEGENSIAPLSKLPQGMFFGGGVPIKRGDKTIGAIGASGAQPDDAFVRAGLDKIIDRLP